MDKKQNGPVFEAGPGWGGKVKAWFGKYFYKVILPVIVVALIGYGITNRNSGENNDTLSPLDTNLPSNSTATISQTVNKGDGKILVARRAIAQYLTENSDISMTAGQKVYLETVLAQTIDNSLFKNGETVNFSVNDILSQIEKARLLTPIQLDKWEVYARKAGVK